MILELRRSLSEAPEVVWPLLIIVALALAVSACGPPSWPEVAYSTEADTVRFAVAPADPIEGEEVTIVLPMGSVSGCHAFDGSVRREVIDGVTHVALDGASAGACEIVAASGSGSSQALGTLAPGPYELRAGALTRSFEVRASSTAPGPPPLWWQVAHAVAERNAVASACSAPYERSAAERPWSQRDPRLHHQVAAAHPTWTDAQIEGAMCAAQSVQVRAVSEHELRYRHSASSLCHTAEAIGTVRVHDDGTFEIEAPYIVDGRDVPC